MLPFKLFFGVYAAPVSSIGFGRKQWDVNIALLSKEPLQALTGKDAKAAYFLTLDYRF